MASAPSGPKTGSAAQRDVGNLEMQDGVAAAIGRGKAQCLAPSDDGSLDRE